MSKDAHYPRNSDQQAYRLSAYILTFSYFGCGNTCLIQFVSHKPPTIFLEKNGTDKVLNGRIMSWESGRRRSRIGSRINIRNVPGIKTLCSPTSQGTSHFALFVEVGDLRCTIPCHYMTLVRLQLYNIFISTEVLENLDESRRGT